jgi:hypothetical protein
VNQDGIVYQKDLGKVVQEYNPDASWRKAEDESAQTASAQ